MPSPSSCYDLQPIRLAMNYLKTGGLIELVWSPGLLGPYIWSILFFLLWFYKWRWHERRNSLWLLTRNTWNVTAEKERENWKGTHFETTFYIFIFIFINKRPIIPFKISISPLKMIKMSSSLKLYNFFLVFFFVCHFMYYPISIKNYPN